jgi:hypothetical protein
MAHAALPPSSPTRAKVGQPRVRMISLRRSVRARSDSVCGVPSRSAWSRSSIAINSSCSALSKAAVEADAGAAVAVPRDGPGATRRSAGGPGRGVATRRGAAGPPAAGLPAAGRPATGAARHRLSPGAAKRHKARVRRAASRGAAPVAGVVPGGEPAVAGESPATGERRDGLPSRIGPDQVVVRPVEPDPAQVRHRGGAEVPAEGELHRAQGDRGGAGDVGGPGRPDVRTTAGDPADGRR